MILEKRESMTFDVSAAPTARPVFPALPFEEWEGTKETLHRYVQIVGKVRLGCCAPPNVGVSA